MTDPPVFAIPTTRLSLRDPTENDLPHIHRFRSDAVATRTMQFLPESRDESRAWLANVIHHNRLAPRVAYNLAIETTHDQRVIGWIGFGPSERSEAPGVFGVGYMLGSDAWGQGYATEAVGAALAFMRDQLDARSVAAWCFTANVASARVLMKSGLREVRQFTEYDPVSGCDLPATGFALAFPRT